MARQGQNAAAEAAGASAAPARQQKRGRKAVVKLVRAHRVNLHVQIADLKIKYSIMHKPPRWAEALIEYVKTHGRHRRITTGGYSRFQSGWTTYKNDMYVAKLTLKKLRKLVTSAPSWRSSPYAVEIVRKIRELGA